MRASGRPAPVIDVRRHDAVIFDMDGVVTDSASIHAAAWTELFDAFLAECPAEPGQDRAPFTDADYQRFVDGKPRYSGVADFLAARGISLPWGDPSDPEHAATVCGLGNRKDHLFWDRLARDGVRVFESTVALVRELRDAGIGTAIFSASRHCAQVLEAAGVGDLFAVRVDGTVAEELGLAGKPDPAMLVEAARRLGADPSRTVVVEDAEAGVTAGRRGGFALVIGIDRTGHADQLRSHGADVVVTDLAEVRVRAGFRRMSEVSGALESWPRISALFDTENVAVLMDFDGTVAEIVPDPDTATLVEGAAAAITALAEVCPVAIISGRDLTDLRKRVRLAGIWYAGSHGFELVAPDGGYHVHDAAPAAEQAIASAAADLGRRVGDIPGVRVEHKRFAVAMHYRNAAPDVVARAIGAVHAVAQQGGLRVTNGRKVTELRPDVDWDKGRALDWILDHLPGPELPIYLGDDLTDEDGFDAVASHGIGIVVRHSEDGDRRTAARFAVDSPARARDLLDRMAGTLARASDSAADAWTLVFDGYDPHTEKLREALCTVGNGYFATRGAAPESRAGEHHYPGTYAAGIYDRRSDKLAGRTVDNESLVNLPNWLPVSFRIDDGEWFDIDTTELLSYRQELDLRRAVLTRSFRFRDTADRITQVTQRRFATMHRPHVCAMETVIVAENWSGRLVIRSTLDGAVQNSLVQRYRALSGDHLTPVRATKLSTDSVLLVVQTSRSRIPVAMAARNRIQRDGETITDTGQLVEQNGMIGHDIDIQMTAGAAATLEKVVTVFTGRDHASSTPEEEAARWMSCQPGFADLLDGHTAAWEHLWDRLRIDLQDRENAVRILRLHLLHLVQTLSPNTADLDVGVPARGLHGEAYRGHVFWDELFVFPVLNLRFPALTRSLLRYRYRRLAEARRAAAESGWAGAMFPWQSGSDGREESQQMHLNPRSGRWNPDPSHRARHIGIAIAYNVWHYYQATDDREFLTEYGTEMLVEIARFWASIATYDAERDRYRIHGVIGPDEFHSGYPAAPHDGIDDNAYTNVMAVWVILRALDALELLTPRDRAELMETLGVAASEPAHWAEVSRRMHVPFHDGVISQFEGYDQLAELDWDRYRQRYGDIRRLDRILEAEGDDVNRYQAGKQADVLMLFYLLSSDELRELLQRLGYDLPGEMIPRTIDYYLARTSHGSTLSSVVHTWVLARANRDRAIEFFNSVLESDIGDIQGGTTAEGIHLGAIAGSIDLVQRCLTGLETRNGRLIFTPHWPESLGWLEFPISYRGHRLTIRISGDGVQVRSEPGELAPIEIECRGHVEQLPPGWTFRVERRSARPRIYGNDSQ
ncbi:trehalose-phosphatase [Nocardia anaemiae]|uniref:trehalose-phosphatase n=1 Tax=Nocardia anaemiae TaxID=263910 RepID=UPI002480A0B7|nr:trehalose-phosphatase [Nocardia anaemiae]